jgi:hypothetical protein
VTPTRLYDLVYLLHALAIVLLMQCTEHAGSYPGLMSSDADALLNTVCFRVHAFLVYRLPPPPALRAKTAFIMRHSEAKSMSCKII